METVAAVLRVSVVEPVALAGLKDAVTPFGRPLAEKETAPLKPFAGTTVIATFPLAPGATLRLGGAAVSVKLGGAATVSVSVTVWVKLPATPVTVTLALPSAAPAAALRESVVEPVALAGEKEAVIPLGKLPAEKVTLPLNPPLGTTLMPAFTLPPCVTLTLAGGG